MEPFKNLTLEGSEVAFYYKDWYPSVQVHIVQFRGWD